MSYCPEDGLKMRQTGETDSSVGYHCPKECLWTYNANDGMYHCIGSAPYVTDPTDPKLMPDTVGTWIVTLDVEMRVSPTQDEINDVQSLWACSGDPEAEWTAEEVAMARLRDRDGFKERSVTSSRQVREE